MSLPKSAAILLSAAVAAAAQVPVDLNGLVVAARTYTSHRLQGEGSPATLDLRLMRGDNGGDASTLMATAADVHRWTVFYDATYKGGSPDLPVKRPASASVKCTRGLFGDFILAENPIPDVKTMESTWFAVSLDGAIAQLNANGYVRGFSAVEVKRADYQGISDEPAYVFTCPWERTRAAFSANTGAMIWYQMF